MAVVEGVVVSRKHAKVFCEVLICDKIAHVLRGRVAYSIPVLLAALSLSRVRVLRIMRFLKISPCFQTPFGRQHRRARSPFHFLKVFLVDVLMQLRVGNRGLLLAKVIVLRLEHLLLKERVFGIAYSVGERGVG